MTKCPFCGGKRMPGGEVDTCYSCGTRWDRLGERRIVRTLEFDGTGKKWWWNLVDEGSMVVKTEGVVDGRSTVLETEVP